MDGESRIRKVRRGNQAACYFALYSPILLRVAEDDRKKNALLIAASLIAAVRTAREERILPTIPRLITRIDESVRLAEVVLEQISKRGNGVAPERNTNALVVAASSIVAVRTAREEKIDTTSWPIINRVDDSVRLAEMVWKRIERKE
jgi:hypothetical protein